MLFPSDFRHGLSFTSSDLTPKNGSTCDLIALPNCACGAVTVCTRAAVLRSGFTNADGTQASKWEWMWLVIWVV